MRVTNKMLANNFLSDMNVNLNNMKTLQQQMASGKKFRRASDDPFNVARAMQMHSSINANQQYNKNITNVINWMDTTDTALGQMGNVFQSIREKLVSAGNAAYGSDERQKIKDEINQRVGQVAQILNTSFDGEYIFAGTRGASKPVDSKTQFNIPAKVDKTNSSGGDAVLSGDFTGTSALSYKIKVTGVTAATGNVTTAEYSTDNGSTWTSTTVSGGTFDIGNGLKIKINDATANANGDVYSFSINQDSKLTYCNSNGTEMVVDPVQSDIVADVAANWSGKDIKFSITDSSTATPVEESISLGDFTAAGKTIKDVVDDINGKLNSSSSLKGKLVAEQTADNRISFKALGNDIIKILPDVVGPPPSTSVTDLQSSINKQLPSTQFDNIQSKRQTELSQGVLVGYNVSAVDVLKYGTSEQDDIRNLLDRVVKHLNGMVEQKDASGNVLKDSSGNILYIADSSKATSALTNDDLKDMDKAMSQILKVRSEVGAKQNRMESAKEQNEQSNLDMTDILSKTEDIDITEKTMEFATMQTVYLASLQTSAKVLQPTLMDYMG